MLAYRDIQHVIPDIVTYKDVGDNTGKEIFAIELQMKFQSR